jgi:CRISPR/Cas system-associated exonuclease Cas4 (RecB family)
MTRFGIERVVNYVTCPALSFLNSNLEHKTYKAIVRERMRSGLNDIIIHMLDTNKPRKSDVGRVVNRIFKNLNNKNIDKDMAEISTYLGNISNLLISNESIITGAAIPIEMAYGRAIVESCIDMTVKDEKTGYINPVIIDISKTRYEPFYNPVIYRCQVAADYLEVFKNNTKVIVYSLAPIKRWEYEHRKYSEILSTSIVDNVESMIEERWPVRFGFWCATCSYRGVCHKLIEYTG